MIPTVGQRLFCRGGDGGARRGTDGPFLIVQSEDEIVSPCIEDVLVSVGRESNRIEVRHTFNGEVPTHLERRRITHLGTGAKLDRLASKRPSHNRSCATTVRRTF
ncbi:hypothetical protein D3C81_1951620 [compost metagenome]